MVKVYIMCGLPFSGKTILSKRIASFDHATRVSFDELWVELEHADANFPGPGVRGWEYVCQKAEDEIERLVQEGNDVVYDNLNIRKEHRDRIRAIASQYNAAAVVVYLNASVDEVRKREAQNKLNLARHSVQSENFKNAVDQFEAMQEDEYFLVYNSKTPVDFWLSEFVTDDDTRSLDLHHLSLRNFKKFVGVICYLLIDKHRQFDLIIGSGNSGLVAAKFTELIYQQLHIACPPVLQIPMLRYKGKQDVDKNLFDNDLLLPEIKEKLADLGVKQLSNVLFVDDEIGLGITAKTCLKLLRQSLGESSFVRKFTYTVVAEDQGVQWEDDLPAIIEFYPFAQELPDRSNVIMWFLPGEIVHPIEYAIKEVKGSHTVMNVLLGLPIKVKTEKIQAPFFSYSINQKALSQVSNLGELQQKALAEISALIGVAIVESGPDHI